MTKEKKISIAYFGSPALSVKLLDKLLYATAASIPLIVTQPDKPSGKRLLNTQTPVKEYAVKHCIDVFDKAISPENEELLIEMMAKKKIDLGIVFAYGQFLSIKLLNSLKYGFWNVHPSLLPKYRGPSPLIYPILNGDNKTGITLIQVNENMDQGNIIKQQEFPIGESTTRLDIESQIAPIASKLIQSTLSDLINGLDIATYPQNNDMATFTKSIKKQDGLVELKILDKALKGKDNEAVNINRKYRAFTTWPGIWTKIISNNKELRLKLLDLDLINNKIILKIVQPEGKKPVSFKQWNEAYRIFPLR